MSLKKFGIQKGVNLQPQTSLTNSAKGDLEVDNSNGKLQYHNGSTDSSVVTEAQAATLTNKVIDADANTITNIENADIKAAAAIALNKLAATTVSRALVSDASGFVSPATTTATEIGYVNGVTSSIQTQLNSITSSGISSLTGDVTAAGPGAAVATIAANAVTNAKAAQMPTLTLKGNNTGGTANAIDLTTTQVNTMLGTLSNPMSTTGDMIYGGTSGVATRLPVGTSDQYLKSNGAAAPTWTTFTLPTVQRFFGSTTSNVTGTYTTPAGVKWLRVTVLGGGGGGGGGGGAGGGGSSGGAGGDSFFRVGASPEILRSNGGGGGIVGSSTALGGTPGGTTSLTPSIPVYNVGGSYGGSGNITSAASSFGLGGTGGTSPLGGSGRAGTNSSGSNASTNTGSGAGGGGFGSTATSNPGGGGGGGSGGYIIAIIPSPSASYSYQAGGGGTAGNGVTTGGFAGGVGGEGFVIVEEFYH